MSSREAPLTFRELRAARQELHDAKLIHAGSVREFKGHAGDSFRVTLPKAADGAKEETEEEKARPRHLSTTASCLESLADVEPAVAKIPSEDEPLVERFSNRALNANPERWNSEGKAHVYCRVRTLPAIIRFAPDDVVTNHAPRLTELLKPVWDTVDIADPDRQAIAEADLYATDSREERRYPPNAFHTFWALRSLKSYEQRGLAPLPVTELTARRQVARLWARQEMAEQASLIFSEAPGADPQHMAWALCADLHELDEPLTAASDRYPAYRAGLAAFFKCQQDSGAWPMSRPLFHYPTAGNAYCYVFETLVELLRPAMPREDGRAYRELLRPYARNLLDAWRLAQRTRIKLPSTAGSETHYGWSSGHHPHRRQPEGWATAAVFSFGEVLRCLVGQWTAEEATSYLRVRPPKFTTRDKGREALAERGDTWVEHPRDTVARRLAGLFVHPRNAHAPDERVVDPDTRLVSSDDARSAILFGPPGTSKTTLVEAVAASIGWRFVDIQAADFLSEGMDRVPARADEIFAALMELDRCVILFDEIDELIRTRGAQESDPFGRFLTTSMLPKIAQLWEQKRVLFFVATNHIDKADPAIRRSQRFDAALLVMPPSFKRKADELRKQLGGAELPPKLKQRDVVADLKNENVTTAGAPLAVFGLLRWDQLPELAAALKGAEDPDQTLLATLARMGDGLKRVEWHHEEHDPYSLYRHYVTFERRDYGKRFLIHVEQTLKEVPPGAEDEEPVARRASGSEYWRVARLDEYAVNTKSELILQHGRVKLTDGYVLSFDGHSPGRSSS